MNFHFIVQPHLLPFVSHAPDLPAILMHHSPVGVEYIQKRGIDLMLAGHTHGGGQVFPATIISNLFFPFKDGLFDYKGMNLYVSEGAGTFGSPMRLGTMNEVTLVRLIKE